MARHASLNEFISDEQEANLRKLAAYLLTLPADYPDFEMSNYVSGGGESGYGWPIARVPACGTAACAVGHGPAAGFVPNGTETWDQYSFRHFISKGSDGLWQWCFGGQWSDVDNTVHGAAKRILWLLENAVPENADGQIYGKAPLCYTDMVLA